MRVLLGKNYSLMCGSLCPKKNSYVFFLPKNPLSVFSLPNIPPRVVQPKLFFFLFIWQPTPMEYFISFLEMCVDMSTHQILSTLTFLSKKNKRISRPLCVLCTKWPLPSYFHAYKLPSRCMFKMQPCLPKNWVVCGGDPLGMVRPVEIKIWMSCGPLNGGWFP